MEHKQHRADKQRAHNAGGKNFFFVQFFAFSGNDDTAEQNVQSGVAERFYERKIPLENRRAVADVYCKQKRDEQRYEQGVGELYFFYAADNQRAREQSGYYSQRPNARKRVKSKVPARQHCRDGRKRRDEYARAYSRVVGQGVYPSRHEEQHFQHRHKHGGQRDVQGRGFAEKQGYFTSRRKSRTYNGADVKKTHFERAPHTQSYFSEIRIIRNTVQNVDFVPFEA